MSNSTIILTQFNSGELSPLISGRVDIDAYRKGSRSMMNFIPTVQGPAKRRAGTQYLGHSGNKTLLIPFVRSSTEAYVCELSSGSMRFWYNGGLIGLPIGTLYSQADLFYDDGTPAIQAVQSADVMYLVHPNHPPQKLQHFSPTNWTLTAPQFMDGPWLPENSDTGNYMQISNYLGSGVTVTADSDTFSPNCVGQLLRIYQSDLSQVKAWYPGQRTTGGAIAPGIYERSGPNNYLCLDASSPSGVVTWVETGSDTLITTSGAQWDGPRDKVPDPNSPGNYYARGVQWGYADSGYGVGIITQYLDAQHVVINVLRNFPKSLMTTGGMFVKSNRWQLGAWSKDNGYPSCVCFFRERLTFGGGIWVWMSVAGDFENFADQTFGVVAQDNAVTQLILSDEINTVKWLSPSDILLVGTEGSEHVIEQNTLNEPFGPLNVATNKQSNYGGRAIPPIRVGGSSFFVTRTGRQLREFVYEVQPDNYESHDATVLSEQVTQTGLVDMDWALNPDSVIWCARSDGKLVGFTINKEQQCQAWHPHQLGGDGKIISIAVVPSPDGLSDSVHFTVQRVINGSTVYYIERLKPTFLDGDDQEDAFYVDCGSTYDGAATTTISGLSYLEGETVSVFADGQPVADKTVSGGSITLDVAASVVQVGLPYPSWILPMKIEAGATDGTSQGDIKRINKVVFRFLNSLGGKYGADPTNPDLYADDLSYSDIPTAISDGTTFFTGDTPQLAWPDGYSQAGHLGLYTDQPLPMTLCAIICKEVTYEGWGNS